ncbi:hypothetical protein [Fibrobacter sp.]|uniref:hypothetical protein n=1 Tax=Fibrobacter sp. TaxID=35828 RepID=UPI0025BCB205|nr:hypothetical protein [Fibrobacter sp.]MBR3070995.1 hypothetical protein [Fibrobacter sp.]
MKRVLDKSIGKCWLLMDAEEVMNAWPQDKKNCKKLLGMANKKLTACKKQLFWGMYDDDKILFLYMCLRLKSQKWFKQDLSCPNGTWQLCLKLWKNGPFLKKDIPQKFQKVIKNIGFPLSIANNCALLKNYNDPNDAVDDVKKIMEGIKS